MQPRAPRWIRRWKFVSSQILYYHLKLKAVGSRFNIPDTQPCRLRLQKRNGIVRSLCQFLRQRLDAQVLTVLVQHSQHEEIRSDKRVPVQPRPEFTQHSSSGRDSLDFRHVARLTTRLVAIIAMQPFLVGSLLGQRADFFAARIERGGVQSVTRSAQRGIAYVRCLGRTESCRRRMHDALLSVLNLKRSIFRTVVFRDRRIDHESSDKPLPR